MWYNNVGEALVSCREYLLVGSCPPEASSCLNERFIHPF